MYTSGGWSSIFVLHTLHGCIFPSQGEAAADLVEGIGKCFLCLTHHRVSAPRSVFWLLFESHDSYLRRKA